MYIIDENIYIYMTTIYNLITAMTSRERARPWKQHPRMVLDAFKQVAKAGCIVYRPQPILDHCDHNGFHTHHRAHSYFQLKYCYLHSYRWQIIAFSILTIGVQQRKRIYREDQVLCDMTGVVRFYVVLHYSSIIIEITACFN